MNPPLSSALPCAAEYGCAHSRGVSDWLHVRPELDLRVALTPGGCQIGDMEHTGFHPLVGVWEYITKGDGTAIATRMMLQNSVVKSAKPHRQVRDGVAQCGPHVLGRKLQDAHRIVAAQVEFRKQTLKPGFHFIGRKG
jgi:hypothetical protein